MRRRGFLGILGGVATAPYFVWKKRGWKPPFVAPPKVWIDGELVENLLEASLIEDNLPKLTRPGQDSSLCITSKFEADKTADLPDWMTEEGDRKLRIDLRLRGKYWSMSGIATTVVVVSPLDLITKVEAAFRVWDLRRL